MAQKMEEKKELHIVKTELKQKQNVLNLDTNEDEQIVVTTVKYSVPNGMEIAAALKEMLKVVSPVEKQVEALCAYATSQSYKESKDSALAKGNYLTQAIRSKIVQILQATDAFAEVSAKDTYDRWFAGFKAKKPSALKVLDRAKAAAEEFSDL